MPARDRSTLYRLIAAGQLAHQALLAPALARGLEPGDDALLYLLASGGKVTEAEFAAELGISPAALAPHIARLIDHDLVRRKASGPQMLPRLKLTARGARIEAMLAGNWVALEAHVLKGLKKPARRTLSRHLKQIVARLA